MALPRKARLAAALWLIFAVVVWNVVFDRMVVVAGRLYIAAAKEVAQNGDSVLLIGDWMPAAVARAFWVASAAGSGVATIGFAGIAWALRGRPAPAARLEDVAG